MKCKYNIHNTPTQYSHTSLTYKDHTQHANTTFTTLTHNTHTHHSHTSLTHNTLPLLLNVVPGCFDDQKSLSSTAHPLNQIELSPLAVATQYNTPFLGVVTLGYVLSFAENCPGPCQRGTPLNLLLDCTVLF